MVLRGLHDILVSGADAFAPDVDQATGKKTTEQ
jgi:hypothetical protein